MNKRKLIAAITNLKIKMMDRDSMICAALKSISVADRDIYIEFQRIENELKEGK